MIDKEVIELVLWSTVGVALGALLFLAFLSLIIFISSYVFEKNISWTIKLYLSVFACTCVAWYYYQKFLKNVLIDYMPKEIDEEATSENQIGSCIGQWLWVMSREPVFIRHASAKYVQRKFFGRQAGPSVCGEVIRHSSYSNSNFTYCGRGFPVIDECIFYIERRGYRFLMYRIYWSKLKAFIQDLQKDVAAFDGWKGSGGRLSGIGGFFGSAHSEPKLNALPSSDGGQNERKNSYRSGPANQPPIGVLFILAILGFLGCFVVGLCGWDYFYKGRRFLGSALVGGSWGLGALGLILWFGMPL